MENRTRDVKQPSKRPVLTDHAISIIGSRLEKNEGVRRPLPIWGRLHIDRQLPFLCVYRRPKGGDETGTDRLVNGEAAYLLASGERRFSRELASLVEGVAERMAAAFGAFLVVEIWPGPTETEGPPYQPAFRVVQSRRTKISPTVDILVRSLKEVRAKGQFAEVEVHEAAKVAPPNLPALVTPAMARNNCYVLGIEVRPVYWDAETRQNLPLIRRALHRRFSIALKRCVFEFTRSRTDQRPPHYHSLGRRAIVKAVWDVDNQLAQVSNGFDFLLSISPTNPDAAWRAFQRSRFQTAPEFTYRPLPIDPPLTKRALFRVPIERIEDPTLAQLFRDQQTELDRKLTLLGERGSPRFLHGSLALFGGIDEPLAALARRLLEQIPPRVRDSAGKAIDATAFAARARDEIEHYRNSWSGVTSTVHVRDDLSGLMVSRGNLLIGKGTAIPAARVEALLSHEVGTHVLTYFNGHAQPFKQLYVGLPNYEPLQEGLAVFAEHLVGGLSRARLRLLAARVLAVEDLIHGATFVDVFRALVDKHGFTQRVSFGITLRTFRCGGFTKDAVYLRGLVALLGYLARGGDFDRLFVGKFGAEHVPIIKELQWRRVLGPPPLRPRYLDLPEAQDRLRKVREGVSVLDFLKETK